MGPVGEDIDDEDDHGGKVPSKIYRNRLKVAIVPIQIIHHEEDPDMASDDEGLRFEGGVFSAEAGFPFGAPFINITAGRDPAPMFLSRRSRSGRVITSQILITRDLP